MKKILFTLSVLLIPTLVSAKTFEVQRVMDGTTYLLKNDKIVRMIGVAIPDNQDKTNYKQARSFSRFDDHPRVRLEYDKQKKNKKGELLAYVYAQQCFDEEKKNCIEHFMNEKVVAAGWAVPRKHAKNSQYDENIEAAFHRAKKLQRGFWAQQGSNELLTRNVTDNIPSVWTDSEACPFEENYKKADLIFSGEYIDITKSKERGYVYDLVFRVIDDFKNIPQDSIILHSFKKTYFNFDKPYLIYAYELKGGSGYYFEHECNRSRLLESASEELKKLQSVKK